MLKKYFTLEEANNLLPTLDKELIALQELQKKFKSELKRVNQLKKIDKDSEEVFMKESELEFLQLEAQLHVRNIQATGAQLKGIDMGLLDFPAIINGKEVLLCWRQGESEITHYHAEDEGFAGRKTLFEGMDY